MKTIPQRIFMPGGVNLNKDARVIRPDQLALSKNAFPVVPGVLGKRNGTGIDRTAIKSIDYKFKPLAWAQPPAITGFQFVAHLHKTTQPSDPHSNILVASNFSLETDTFPNSLQQLVGEPLSDYDPVRFINYRGTCLAIVPGMEGFYSLVTKASNFGAAEGYEWVRSSFKFDPAATSDQPSQIIPVTPRVGCQYRQRMVWGNFGPGKGNWLIFADKASTNVTLQPRFPLAALVGEDVLAYNGRHVEVGSIENEDIAAIQEITLGAVGSAVESALLVLTDRSCVLVTGEILGTYESGADSPTGLFGTYRENRVNYEAGCASPQTLCKTPYGWIWASGDDVWMLTGNYPTRIGTNIRPALLGCPAITRKHWSMAYANGVVVLDIITTSEFGDTTNYLHQYWMLDMRDGPPQSAEEARWFGPMEFAETDTSIQDIGPLLSIRDNDGTQRILAMVLSDNDASDFPVTTIIDVFTRASAHDLMVGDITSGLEWTPTEMYNPGDVVRPRLGSSNTAGMHGRVFTCVSKCLNYDNQSFNFGVGNNILGAVSGATAKIVNDIDGGTSGTLVLANIVGTFIDNESIVETGGFFGTADANGTLYNGTSGSSDPTWGTSDGAIVQDGTIVWEEILGDTYQRRVLQQRQNGEFQVDIRSRDSALDDSTHEKLLRRIDVNVAAASKVSLGVNVTANQSDVTSLDSNIFGPNPLEIGVNKLPVTIAGVKSISRAFRPDESALIQGRQLQAQLVDSTAFIIDDSNDHLCLAWFIFSDNWVSYTQATAKVLQIQLVHGSYATIDTVLASIAGKLNTFLAELQAASGLVSDPDSWTTDSAYVAAHPYFSKLSLAYTDPGSETPMLAFLFGSGLNSEPAAGVVVGDNTSTVYVDRCKRLCAMLGFDTGQTMVDGAGFTLPVDISFFSLYPSVFTTSPITFNGSSVVQEKNSQRFDIAEANMLVQPKTGIPLRDTDRG